MHKRQRILVVALFACLAAEAQTTTTRRISAPESFYDDASINDPGVVGVSMGAGYREVSAGHDFGAPSLDLSVGITRRLELNASSGYAKSRFEDLRISGLSDSYFSAKVLLVREGDRMPAIAIKPTIEVLGRPSVAYDLLAPARVNLMIPVAIEKSSSWSRTYLMAGYNTRGIAFASLVNELNVWSKFTPSVILAYGRLTRDLGLISDLNLNRSRLDVEGSGSFAVAPHWSVYIGAGRSLGRTDPNSTSFSVSGGLGYNFRLWGHR